MAASPHAMAKLILLAFFECHRQALVEGENRTADSMKVKTAKLLESADAVSIKALVTIIQDEPLHFFKDAVDNIKNLYQPAMLADVMLGKVKQGILKQAIIAENLALLEIFFGDGEFRRFIRVPPKQFSLPFFKGFATTRALPSKFAEEYYKSDQDNPMQVTTKAQEQIKMMKRQAIIDFLKCYCDIALPAMVVPMQLDLEEEFSISATDADEASVDDSPSSSSAVIISLAWAAGRCSPTRSPHQESIEHSPQSPSIR